MARRLRRVTRTGRIERTGHRDSQDVWRTDQRLRRIGGRAQDGLQAARVLDLGASRERGADGVRASREWHPHLQACLDRVRVRGLVLQHALEVLGAADGLGEDLPTVHHDLQLARELEPANQAEIGLEQPDLDHVLAVERQRGCHGHAAARAERQALVVPVLRMIGRGAKHAGPGHDVRGVADSEGGDLGRRGSVALQQRRRGVQHLADVVETVGRLVGRQKRRDVHVERQQIANRVGVLGAVQAMDRGMAGKRRGRSIDGALEPRDQAVACRGVGPRHSRRRHHARPDLPDHPLPDRGVGRHAGRSMASSAKPPVFSRWLWQVTQ